MIVDDEMVPKSLRKEGTTT